MMPILAQPTKSTWLVRDHDLHASTGQPTKHNHTRTNTRNGARVCHTCIHAPLSNLQVKQNACMYHINVTYKLTRDLVQTRSEAHMKESPFSADSRAGSVEHRSVSAPVPVRRALSKQGSALVSSSPEYVLPSSIPGRVREAALARRCANVSRQRMLPATNPALELGVVWNGCVSRGNSREFACGTVSDGGCDGGCDGGGKGALLRA